MTLRPWSGRTALCASALGLMIATAAAGQESRPNDQVTPLAAVNTFIAAQAAFDRAALDRIVTADFVEISPRGAVDERPAFLGFYDPARRPAARIGISGSQPSVHGDREQAFVSMVLTYAVNGAARPDGVRAGYALRRMKGRWRVASAQYTPLAAAAR